MTSPFRDFFVGIAVFFTCLGQQFTIEDATYSAIKGGVRDAGITMAYTIDVRACKPADDLQFQYLYIQGKAWPVELIDQYGSRIGTYKKKDIITLRASGRYKPEQQYTLPADVALPANMQDKDLIIYTHNGTQKFQEIEELKKSKEINAP